MNMKIKNFVNLHVHSDYSLMDSLCKIKNLVNKAKAYNMPALTLTDHGTMGGCKEFSNECKKQNIKPIFGCEIYYSRNLIKSKENINNHLTLLVKNEQGMKNLYHIISEGYNNFYHKPRIGIELLKKYSQGLICLSGCLKSEISIMILKGEPDEKIYEVIKDYINIFGENFYFETQGNLIQNQDKINKWFDNVTQTIFKQIKIVATNDIHYLNQEDYKIHEMLICLSHGESINNPNRKKWDTNQLHFKNYEEMIKSNLEEEWLDNTLEIMDKCNYEIPSGKILFPKFDIPTSHSKEDYLKALIKDEYDLKYPENNIEIEKRINHELEIIFKLNFTDYFLIIMDIIQECNKRNILVGPGRGSVCGSEVAYLLGIHKIDPIKYDLIFERFLNPDRISPPDIDTDFEDSRRNEVFEYVINKYGAEKVSKVTVYNKRGAKQAIKDISKIYDISFHISQEYSDLFSPKETITEALISNPIVINKYKSDNIFKKIVDASIRIEGLIRQVGIHAGGLIIAPGDIHNYAPIAIREKEKVSEYDKDMAEEVGLLKFDFLGLENLGIIKETQRLVEISRKELINIKPENFTYDDKKVFKTIQDKGVGCFQLGSTGIRATASKLKINNINDVIDLITIYRPGVMDAGMLDEYIERKHNRKSINILPELKDILKETYGIPIYQEQIMKIVVKVAGFTLAEADDLRKAVAKKKPEKLKKIKEHFYKGCEENKIDKNKTDEIWNSIEAFGAYGFNRSHAAGYSNLTYITGYLKTYYTIEFLCASLNNCANQKETLLFFKECKKYKIKILPPDINISKEKFSVESNKSIRFGLSFIKDVGYLTSTYITTQRNKDGVFKDVIDFGIRVREVDKGGLTGLIKGGAFDGLKYNRRQMVEMASEITNKCSGHKENKSQISLFSNTEIENFIDIRIKIPEINEYSNEDLYIQEKETIGITLSSNPLKDYESIIEEKSTPNLDESHNKQSVIVGGIVTNYVEKVTRKGQPMLIGHLETPQGGIEILCFGSKSLETFLPFLMNKKPILVRGVYNTYGDDSNIIIEKIVEIKRT